MKLETQKKTHSFIGMIVVFLPAIVAILMLTIQTITLHKAERWDCKFEGNNIVIKDDTAKEGYRPYLFSTGSYDDARIRIITRVWVDGIFVGQDTTYYSVDSITAVRKSRFTTIIINK